MTASSPSVVPWTALLLMGPSGVGKTTAAQTLAGRYGVPWLGADDVRIALQRVARPCHHPDLHFFLTTPDVWSLPVPQLVDGWIGVARVVSSALEEIIAHHLAVSAVGPLIIEGDGILPALAARASFGGIHAAPGCIQGVLVDEPDADALLQQMLLRGRGFAIEPSATQRAMALAACQFGRWLRAEADRHTIPVVPSRPLSTLADRIEVALQ
jgi:2-phosphoglycerate kinase